MDVVPVTRTSRMAAAVATVVLLLMAGGCVGDFTAAPDQLVPEDCYIQSSLAQGRSRRKAHLPLRRSWIPNNHDGMKKDS